MHRQPTGYHAIAATGSCASSANRLGWGYHATAATGSCSLSTNRLGQGTALQPQLGSRHCEATDWGGGIVCGTNWVLYIERQPTRVGVPRANNGVVYTSRWLLATGRGLNSNYRMRGAQQRTGALQRKSLLVRIQTGCPTTAHDTTGSLLTHTASRTTAKYATSL